MDHRRFCFFLPPALPFSPSGCCQARSHGNDFSRLRLRSLAPDQRWSFCGQYPTTIMNSAAVAETEKSYLSCPFLCPYCYPCLCPCSYLACTELTYTRADVCDPSLTKRRALLVFHSKGFLCQLVRILQRRQNNKRCCEPGRAWRTHSRRRPT